MIYLKCRMCGGLLNITKNSSVFQCENCSILATIPRLDNDNKISSFNKANELRETCQFDQAAIIFQSLVKDYPDEPEAYWGLLLCRYGIQYVKDYNNTPIPTCHRSGYESILSDQDYKDAIANARDEEQKQTYQREAIQLDQLRANILTASIDFPPYDIFISFKDTDQFGKRTQESIIGENIYDDLTNAGFRVFFSRITLRDVIGSEYEPHIFAALNSAKIMLLLGSSKENMNSTWVKNEWSRFIKLANADSKKIIIPCYINMTTKDFPDEILKIQAHRLDEGDSRSQLLRVIKKILKPTKSAPKQESVFMGNQSQRSTYDINITRGKQELEAGRWKEAARFFETALNFFPESVDAHLGNLLAEMKVVNVDDLKYCKTSFAKSHNYIKLKLYADSELAEKLEHIIKEIDNRIMLEQKESAYTYAVTAFNQIDSWDGCNSVREVFVSLSGYKDSDIYAAKCLELAENLRKESIYQDALINMRNNKYDAAAASFRSIAGYKDADIQIVACMGALEGERQRQEEQKKKDIRTIRKNKIKAVRNSIIIILLHIIAVFYVATYENLDKVLLLVGYSATAFVLVYIAVGVIGFIMLVISLATSDFATKVIGVFYFAVYLFLDYFFFIESERIFEISLIANIILIPLSLLIPLFVFLMVPFSKTKDQK